MKCSNVSLGFPHNTSISGLDSYMAPLLPCTNFMLIHFHDSCIYYRASTFSSFVFIYFPLYSTSYTLIMHFYIKTVHKGNSDSRMHLHYSCNILFPNTHCPALYVYLSIILYFFHQILYRGDPQVMMSLAYVLRLQHP